MSLQLLSLSFLATLLLAAVVSDVRRRRIPNALVLYGIALGLAFQTFAPTGTGLLQGGGLGLGQALLGGATGLALFLPLYALRMMAAGDVKLLAMVGVWLGAAPVVQAALWSMLAGGVLAAVTMLSSGVTHRVGCNLLALCGNAARRAVGRGTRQVVAVTGRLPYGLAIAAGTAVEMARLMRIF
jgi:prepilin peptidase CpaA